MKPNLTPLKHDLNKRLETEDIPKEREAIQTVLNCIPFYEKHLREAEVDILIKRTRERFNLS